MTTETFLDTPHSIVDAPSKSYREILARSPKGHTIPQCTNQTPCRHSGQAPTAVTAVIPDLGFHFNPEENYRIHLAKRHAAQFMETYGNAAPRANQKQIDLTHYIQ